jgi:26S proteasome regulatory subunit N9
MEIDPKPIPEFLEQQREENTPPELQSFFLDFQDHWERKLWHQLTNSLDEFFKHPESGPQRLPLFKNFVLTFADKINQLKLVELGLAASQQCSGRHPTPQSIIGILVS